LLPPELHFLTPICTKSFVGLGFAADPTGGAYSALPDTLAVFRGLLLKRGKGKGGKREMTGRERREGEGGSSSFGLGRKKKSRRLW